MASTPAWEYRAHAGAEGSLLEFVGRYGSERACEERLLEEKFPGGFVCPRCGNRRCSPVAGRAHKWQCTRCSKQVSVTAGTAMEGTKLALTKWFLAMWLVAQDRRGLSGSELARFVGCNERTGQYVLLRLRGAMAGSECLQRP